MVFKAREKAEKLSLDKILKRFNIPSYYPKSAAGRKALFEKSRSVV